MCSSLSKVQAQIFHLYLAYVALFLSNLELKLAKLRYKNANKSLFRLGSAKRVVLVDELTFEVYIFPYSQKIIPAK